jgi:transcriptional regulator with XRE-family HTH domain
VIRKRRDKKKMKPEDLARKAGVDPKAVEYWETGQRTISNQSLPRVAYALGARPSIIYAEAGGTFVLLPAAVRPRYLAPVPTPPPPITWDNNDPTLTWDRLVR